MNKTDMLYLEYEKASKEAVLALDTWEKYDKKDPFSKAAFKAFRELARATDRQNEAFAAWMKAIKQGTT